MIPSEKGRGPHPLSLARTHISLHTQSLSHPKPKTGPETRDPKAIPNPANLEAEFRG